MNIFASKEKGELVLVFDIGSSSIGGALLLMHKSEVPKIVYSVREPITMEDTVDIDRFLVLMNQSLYIVAHKMCKAGAGAPSQIFCVLSSPWHVSQTRIISLKKNVPFIFTAKLAEDLIKKEIGFFEEDHKDKYLHDESGARSIEFKNIKTMLNGYETLNPINQKAEELEMTVYISMSGERILTQIEDTIRKHFHFNAIKFSSFALASFVTVRDMYADQENFLLIDIGGEVTDISMVKKNILRESTSFPLGQNFFIRGISREAECSFDEAKSFVSLLKDDHASEDTSRRLEPIITKLKNEWLKQFQDSMASLSNDISIPSDIFMTAHESFASFFEQTIKNEQFNQYTLTEAKFKINFLDAKVFHGMVTFDDNVVRDSFLLVDCIYINRFLNKI